MEKVAEQDVSGAATAAAAVHAANATLYMHFLLILIFMRSLRRPANLGWHFLRHMPRQAEKEVARICAGCKDVDRARSHCAAAAAAASAYNL